MSFRTSMMTDSLSNFLRHGRTAPSASHLVNGDRNTPVHLDEVGRRQCAAISGEEWLDAVSVSVTSRFPRTAQTADLVLGRRRPRRVVEPRFDEIDYGSFEGGPWAAYGDWLATAGRHARPPGASESLQEATQRFTEGLAAVLALPGPRLVVGHGLMLSILLHLTESPGVLEDRLPEAPYVSPLCIADDALRSVLGRGARVEGCGANQVE